MKHLLLFLIIISTPVFATDHHVVCEPWTSNPMNFSLEMEVEEAGGSYIDAWVTLKVFNEGIEVHSIKSTYSYGAFFIDWLDGKDVLIFQLRPAGGQRDYKYDFLDIAANHPRPSGNSYLTFKGEQYQAECYTK